jgi:hypothetical protein
MGANPVRRTQFLAQFLIDKWAPKRSMVGAFGIQIAVVESNSLTCSCSRSEEP